MTEHADDDLMSPSLGASAPAVGGAGGAGGAGGDLYVPSLDDSHDATDMEPPWEPRSLLIPVLLGGSITGAILYTLNARFIGRRRDWRWIVPLFVALAVIGAAVQLELLRRAKLGSLDQPESAKQIVSFGTRLATLLVAYFVGTRQEARVRLHLGDSRPLLLPAVAAIFGGSALAFLLALVVAVLFSILYTSLGIELPLPD